MPQSSSEITRSFLDKLRNGAHSPVKSPLAVGREASPLFNILKTSLPAAIDLSSQTIMWTIESIMIGRISAAAFAGLGMAIQIIVATMTVLLTFVVGSALMITRHLGAKETREANHIFGQAMIIGGILAVVLSLAWFFGVSHLFKLIKEGGSEAERAGAVYLKTIASFGPFVITNFIALGVIRGVGETRYSMFINVGLNTLNLILAPLLIFGLLGFPRLEVQGAALAAGIAHTCGFVATFILLRSRKCALFLSYLELTTPNLETCKRLFKAGLPTTIEQLVWAFGQLVVTSYVAVLSITLLAAHQVFMRIQAILSMLYMGFGLSAMTLMGKNLGAEQRKLAKSMAETSSTVTFVFVSIVAVVLFFFSSFIMKVFTSDEDVIRVGAFVMKVFAVLQIPKAVNGAVMGSLRGAGDLRWLMWLSLAGVVFFEIGINWGLAMILKASWWALFAFWIVHLVDETVKMAFNQWRFQKGKWRFLSI